MPEEDSPNPDEVQDQMRAAVNRIREKWSETKPDEEPPENQAEELP
jgi:hypothetical protein